MKNISAFFALLALLPLAAPLAAARNVDLSTVPNRDTVQLTIYNSEDITLVRETRLITFKKGINPLQFSWSNTLIDPTSVELRFLSSADKLDVLDTTYPHDKPEQLSWNVASEINGEARVEITYFTSGISWSADYVLIADADEKTLALEGFVRVANNSGEDYENANVRLVVGKINLVEKIAELAMRGKAAKLGASDADSGVGEKRRRNDALRGALAASVNDSWIPRTYAVDFSAAAPMSMAMEAPKEIAKEGVSEYFIFAIPGVETIPSGWSKRMRAIDAEEVPFAVKHRYRPAEYGEQLARVWTLTNDEKSKLGGSPMPDGKVRVFRQNGRGGLAYLAAVDTKYIPAGDKMELNLGADPEVIFELIKLRAFRDNIWLRIGMADVYRRVGEPGIDIDSNSAVQGWDEHGVFNQRIRNFSAKPVDVEVRRAYSGDNDFISMLPGAKNHDNNTVEFSVVVAAGAEKDNIFEILSRNGRNAKQNRVALANAAPAASAQ